MSFLSSPLPPFRRKWRREITVRVFRIVLLLSAVLYPTFGLVYLAVYPEVFDPMFIRVALSVGATLLLLGSFRSDWVQRNAATLLVVVAYVDILWFSFLAYFNDLSYPYALGLFFVYVVAAFLTSLSFDKIRPLIKFLLVGLGIVAVTALAVPAPEASVVLLILFTASAGIAIYVMVAAFIQALAILDRQHTAMVEAQRMAQVGSWEYDPATGRHHWSEGMFALLGMNSTRDEPSLQALLRRVLPTDRRTILRTLHEGAPKSVLTITVAPSSQQPRRMRITCVAEHDSAYRAVRYHGTIRDVSEEVRREAVLVAARDEAERARIAAEELATVKSTLLANMSHEIRTPLTAIIGFSVLLVTEVEGHSREHADLIAQSGYRLLHTLNSVLDLARLRSGNMELSSRPVDVVSSLRSVSAMLAHQIQEKNILLSLALPDGPLWVTADSSALDRVLTNLLSNAVKFTDAGGITLCAKTTGDEVVFQVSDTGPGMSPEFLPRLFEEFRQESEGVKRDHEGSGLGLAITRQLVELMGGRIEVESELGRGTTFSVFLPGCPGDALPDIEEATFVTVAQHESA